MGTATVVRDDGHSPVLELDGRRYGLNTNGSAWLDVDGRYVPMDVSDALDRALMDHRTKIDA